MEAIIFIGAPVLFVVAGLVAALSFAAPAAPEPEPVRAQPEAPARLFHTPIQFTQMQWQPPRPEPLSLEAILANVESHLRHERAAARAFAKDPSSENLWAN